MHPSHSPIAAPPSPQEIHRKLSVHSIATGRSPRPGHLPSHGGTSTSTSAAGNESDSDSVFDAGTITGMSLGPGTGTGGSGTGSIMSGSIMSGSVAPLSSIAERRSGSGADSEDEDEGEGDEGEGEGEGEGEPEDEDEEGGWRGPHGEDARGADESVIKAGYLWKKGERRKTWKKRWFVLRPAHLAYYKTAAEYQLLRLLDLADVHSCTQVALKRHAHAFGLVSPVRTFYLQAKTPGEVAEWVRAIDAARQVLAGPSVTSPIPIPGRRGRGQSGAAPVTPSPPAHGYYMTSSDSEDASPSGARSYSLSSQTRGGVQPGTSPSAAAGVSVSGGTGAGAGTGAKGAVDPGKTILSGYLMKCGSKRRNWRKRWFVLTGEQLVYSGSHMDTKPHRRFPFAEILDALEYDLPANRQNPALMGMHPPPAAGAPSAASHGHSNAHGLGHGHGHGHGQQGSGAAAAGAEDEAAAHTFKIVTTKRTLLLCAPSEEDEIKWLGAVRALLARRSGVGVGSGSGGVSVATADVSPSASGLSSGGSGLVGSGSGLVGRVRRPSASGSAVAGLPPAGIPEEW
ncbi:pleckstrin-like protein [Mycena belliarum]|uniref:Pleckstrin-like protein n=1 Tax=Mycena belliarum TaxID=1033014 RepID=A0AAD6UES9_9AGAR|nr:pleckstrin-like protein [Mycena belliae]